MTGLSVVPLQGMPLFAAGMSVAEAVAAALGRMGLALEPGDVLVLAQKIVSKAEGRARKVTKGDSTDEADRKSTRLNSSHRL